MLAWGSCGRNGRNGAWERAIFNSGKPSSITFNVGAPTLSWANGNRPGGFGSGGQSRGDLIQLYFADLDRGLCICIVCDVAGDFRCMGFKGGLEGLDRLEGQMPHRQKGWGRAR